MTSVAPETPQVRGGGAQSVDGEEVGDRRPPQGVSPYSYFADACDLAGVGPPVRVAFETELGDSRGVTLGALLELPKKDLEEALSSTKVSAEGEQPKKLTPLQKGAIRAAITWSAKQLGRVPPDWGGIAAAQAAPVGTPVATPVAKKRRLNNIVDQ
eukprot:6476452-Amphidinium_carterae.1